MAQISVGAAVGAGFGLIARRPLSVMAWGVVPVVFSAAALALLAPMYLSMWGSFLASAHAGGVTPPTLGPQYLQAQSAVYLIDLIQLAVSAVLYCAVFRAILQPERSSFAYLRVGAAELFTCILAIAALFGFIIAAVVSVIPVAIVAAIVMAASHGGDDGGVAIGFMISLLVVAVMLGLLVLALRFCFAVPMMVADGKFHLFESWTLTRGRFGSLFLIALALVGLLFVLEIVIVTVFVGVGAAAVGSLGGLQAAAASLRQSPGATMARLWPFFAVYAALLIPISGCLVAIWGAPWARAYRDLAPDASQVFA